MFDLQKASMWKRISAWLFDAILLAIVAVLAAWLIGAALNYDGYNAQLDAAYARYGEMYGVDFGLTLEEYDALTPEQAEILNTAYDALSADVEAMQAYSMTLQLMLLMTSLGILLSYVVLEFVIPLCLGNGQTLGKKAFGIGVMRQDGVRVDGRVLFIRTFLGKYTLETMIPVLIILMIWFGILGLMGTLVLFGIALVEIIMLTVTKKRLVIHDAISSTVAVDVGSQMIFPDQEALMAYKKKAHAEKAAREAY